MNPSAWLIRLELIPWITTYFLRSCSSCLMTASVLVQYYELIYPVDLPYLVRRGTAVAQWLRCCATNRKVAGSIPAGVGGFFIDIKSF